MEVGKRAWSPKEHVPNRTFTLGSYKTYSTFVYSPWERWMWHDHGYADAGNRTKPKINAWEPYAAPR